MLYLLDIFNYVIAAFIMLIGVGAIEAVLEEEIGIAKGFFVSVFMLCILGIMLVVYNADIVDEFMMYGALFVAGAYGGIVWIRKRGFGVADLNECPQEIRNGSMADQPCFDV